MKKETYVRVEWPECQHYMDCEDIIHIEDSQDLMVPEDYYDAQEALLKSKLPFHQGQIVTISGLGSKEHYDDYISRDITMNFICINDKWYQFHEDPDDGYRSYGYFGETTTLPKDFDILTEFPKQEVVFNYLAKEEFVNYESINYWKVKLTNKDTDEIILEVGTDYSDSYYPCAIYKWSPENLPINKDR